MPVIWDICLIENIIFTYVKQAFPQIIPFPFDHRFGTKKSPQKVIPGVMSGVILVYFSIGSINITYVKQAFPQIIPFPCDYRLGTKKSSKTTPKIIPKTCLESTNKHNKHNKHKQAQTNIINKKMPVSVLSCSGFGLLLGFILGSFWVHFGIISGVILGVIWGLFCGSFGGYF